ncbi:MAG: PrgI family protein [Candidatus Pacebacteria bacterium]|nr:PrgI family protein [Candidatus Paceibacterota bacterium]
MQQFTVPQFIDVEPTIIGPITIRQFLIIVAGGIVAGASYKLFDFALFVTITIITGILVLLFGFYKVNGRPMHYFCLNLIQTFKKPGLRVWNHKAMASEEIKLENIAFKEIIPRKEAYEKSRLAELSLVVDTQGKYKQLEDVDDIQIEP